MVMRDDWEKIIAVSYVLFLILSFSGG